MKNFALIFFLLFINFASVANENNTKNYEKFSLYVETILNDRLPYDQTKNSIIKNYNEIYHKFTLNDSSSLESVKDYFSATYMVFFYTQDSAYIPALEKSFSYLAKRKALNDKYVYQAYDSYVTLRMFDKAKELLMQHKEFREENLPLVIDRLPKMVLGQRKVWEVDNSSGSLIANDLKLSKDFTIVILTSPRCHFALNFLSELSKNSELKKYFTKNSIFLIPPSGPLDIALVQSWNRLNPQYEMKYINTRLDWPEFDVWATPVFYFFLNGEFKGSVVGWPNGGNEAKILEKIGSLYSTKTSKEN